MEKKAPLILAVLIAVALSIIAIVQVNNPPDFQAMGVTNFDSLHLSDTNATATPALRVNQDGTGEVVEFLAASTPVWAVDTSGDVTQTGAVGVTGDLTVTGDATVTDNAALGDAANDTLTINGDIVFNGIPDTNASDYNEWFKIEGDMTGTGTKDRNYGIVIEMTRGAGEEITNGDHDEAGIKIRMDTEAITTTAGTTLRGMDVEAKADNPSGTTTNLYGASITAKSDTGAGSVDSMIAATFNTQNNAAVVTNLMAADFRLYRQAATVPTNEYGIQVRSSSSTGSGADAAIYLNSDYAGSATTDSWDYGLDVSGAAINTADIRLENGETISNQTDTAIVFAGFVALTEGAVIDLGSGGTITPVASYQPITNATGGSIDTDASTAIANGAVAGALLIICNEDAQSVVIKDGANTLIGGDKTLTGGAQDCITLLWNGADWVGLSFHDN
jgi:hypothetical protein